MVDSLISSCCKIHSCILQLFSSDTVCSYLKWLASSENLHKNLCSSIFSFYLSLLNNFQLPRPLLHPRGSYKSLCMISKLKQTVFGRKHFFLDFDNFLQIPRNMESTLASIPSCLSERLFPDHGTLYCLLYMSNVQSTEVLDFIKAPQWYIYSLG